MAKVFGLHMIRLKPDVKPGDFEKFVREEVSQVSQFEGWKGYVLKGLRGDREGRYLWVFEIESVEALNRFSPGVGPDGFTEEAKQLMEADAGEWDRFRKQWETFATLSGIIFTDYVVVE